MPGSQDSRRPAGQPAVAESGFLLLVEQGLNVKTLLGGGLTDPVMDAEVDQVVFQMGTEQEFRREITDNSDVFALALFDGLDPAVQELIPHGVGKSHVEVVPGGDCRKSLGVEDMFPKSPPHTLDTQVRTAAEGRLLLLIPWLCFLSPFRDSMMRMSQRYRTDEEITSCPSCSSW